MLESQHVENTGDYFRVKQQLRDQQSLTERLQAELSALNEQLLVMHDEHKTLMKNAELSEQTISKLNKKLSRYKSKNGVPQSTVTKLEATLERYKTEIDELKDMLSKHESSAVREQSLIQQLESEKTQLTNYLSRKEKDESKYRKALKEKTKTEKKLEKDIETMAERLKVAEDCTRLKEENEALISQKNVLLKFKESIGRELEKLKQDNENKTIMLLQKDKEFHEFKAEAEKVIERLKSSNDRLSQQMMELDSENNSLSKNLKALEKRLGRMTTT